MGEEITFKMVEFPTFKGPWPWPWIGSCYIPSCITHRPLHTYHISSKSNKLNVNVRTGGRTFETHFIRSTRRSRPNNIAHSGHASWWKLEHGHVWRVPRSLGSLVPGGGCGYAGCTVSAAMTTTHSVINVVTNHSPRNIVRITSLLHPTGRSWLYMEFYCTIIYFIVCTNWTIT